MSEAGSEAGMTKKTSQAGSVQPSIQQQPPSSTGGGGGTKKLWPPQGGDGGAPSNQPSTNNVSKSPAPSEGGATRKPPSGLTPLMRSGSNKSLRPSTAPRTPVSAAPASPVQLSRQGSIPKSPAGSAKSAGGAQEPQQQTSRAGSEVQQPQQLSRRSSAAVSAAASKQSEGRVSEAVEAVKDFFGLGSKSSAAGGSASSSSSSSHQQQQLLQEVQADEPPPQTPMAEAREEPGIDWKMTADEAQHDLEEVRSQLEAERQRCAALEGENASLKQKLTEQEDVPLPKGLKAKEKRIKELEEQLRAGHHSAPSQTSAKGDAALKQKDKQILELRSQLSAEQARTAGDHHQLEDLRRTLQSRSVELQEHKAAIKALETKLEHAQEAIVSATDYGWENDIKLAQARRALVAILDHHSPARARKAGSLARASKERERQEQEEEEERQRQQRASVAALIREYDENKRKAVQEEDYGEAQRLQVEIRQLKTQLGSPTPSQTPRRSGSRCSPSPAHTFSSRGGAG